MSQRIDGPAVAPDLYKALHAVERYLRQNVDEMLYHLVKLRASILNECAFCVDMHSNDALELGESPTRLFAVAAWRESPFFTDAERAALALTDSVTRIGDAGVPDDVWAEAAEHFDEKALADLVAAAAMINLWNRVAIPFRATPLSAVAA